MLRNYPLKELNTWNVGGSCREFSAPAALPEARELLAARLPDKDSLYILGGGSNVLVQDGLLNALVISTARLDKLECRDINGEAVIEAQAGLPVKRLLEFAVRNNLGGCEFLTGIPGTLGGALWGNAGAAGTGFAELADEVESIEADGSVRVWRSSELNWKYRTCPFDERQTILITRTRLKLRYAEPKSIIERIRFFSNLKKGQPIGRKTAGCVFKNPEGFSAGKLLDETGCKRMRIGGAVVSEHHANFIENENGARARDIYELAERCRERVLRARGIRLEYEIHFFGEF